MQDKQKALTTLLMLAKDHRSFFESLNPKCQVCQNIFSSQECDMCGAVNIAITNKRLASFGLISMLDYYTERCVTC